MSGKRKRIGDITVDARIPNTTATNQKPQSAAARLRAEAAKAAVTSELVLDPVTEPPTPLPQSPVPELQESDSDEESLPVKENQRLCNWRNDPRDVISDTETELTVNLSKHTTIALIGSFQFKVLRGAININGANIGRQAPSNQQEQIYTSYSPATHPIFKIRGLDSVNHVQFTNYEGLRPLASINPLFSNIWNATTNENSKRSFSIITESDADVLARPLSPEKCPEDWLRAIESCTTHPSIVFLSGESASGKSRMAKRLLNRFITGQGKSAPAVPAVCYLDLDSAKPEYTPHGQISLVIVRSLNLGPNYTHHAAPSSRSESTRDKAVRSHPIPTNFVNHKSYYRACVEDLFLAYKTLNPRDNGIPLIINPCTSLYSSGFDIFTEMLTRFKPHHLIHLGDPRAMDIEQPTKLQSLQTIVSQFNGTVHNITAQVPTSAPLRTESELRSMQMQSYFHLSKITTTATSWSTSPLTKITPWEFCFEETDTRMQDFVGFAMYSEPVEPASLISALNGSIVHIVESTSSSLPTPYTALPRTSRYRVPFFEKSDRTGMVMPLDPKASKLICVALVHGFDLESRTVQLVVPKTHESLLYSLSPERTVLVGGCCDTPEWAYMEDAYAANGATSTRVMSPWVEDTKRMSDMGYLNTVRRVRKFQT